MNANPIDQINAAMEVAIAAQEAGDFRTAETKARTAWMRISALPDSELSDERLRWKPESIEPIVRELAKRAALQGSGPTGVDGDSRGALFRLTPILYQRG